MAHSRRIAVHAHATRHGRTSAGWKEAPWVTIVLLILVLVMILALWGKLPSRSNQPHQAPRGNAPGGSQLFIDNPSNLRQA